MVMSLKKLTYFSIVNLMKGCFLFENFKKFNDVFFHCQKQLPCNHHFLDII